MFRNTLTLIGIVCIVFSTHAQVPLAEIVGLDGLPADDDPICTIPIYPEITTNLEAPLEGELVHDFKLYTLEGDSVQLSGVLNDGKPVLLIGCSYTCYVYRGKVDIINDMQALYGDQINIFLVYTVEAHPVIDISPYFGYENVGAENYAEGILFRQPTTYGERKELVTEMLDAMSIDVPVLIDGPCNEFWAAYGTNPNPAWLIAPDGIVFDAQKWYNKEPDNMYASIDSILNIVGTGVYTPEGAFTAADEGEEIYYGTVENTIAAHITLTNTSDDNVLIDFVRTDESIPAGWFTAMCTDLCYSPDIDSATVFLTPGQTEIVRVDFFTDDTPASGYVEVTCTNHYQTDNTYTFTINASTVAETAIHDMDALATFAVAPNPAISGSGVVIPFRTTSANATYTILNTAGQPVKQGPVAAGDLHWIGVDVPAGVYQILLTEDKPVAVSTLVVL